MYTLFMQRTITFTLLLTIFILLCYLPSFIFSFLLCTILIYILWREWPALCPYTGIRGSLFTTLYPVLPFMLMIYMNEHYHYLYLAMLIVVASFDTGAYLVGSRLGTHPLFPRVSPGKTWEGVGGGLLFTSITLGIIVWYYQLPYSFLFLTVVAVVLSASALVGDLFESYLKRRAGIKDSAQLLPGHGGFLDRFDSQMAAIFVAYAARSWLK